MNKDAQQKKRGTLAMAGCETAPPALALNDEG